MAMAAAIARARRMESAEAGGAANLGVLVSFEWAFVDKLQR